MADEQRRPKRQRRGEVRNEDEGGKGNKTERGIEPCTSFEGGAGVAIGVEEESCSVFRNLAEHVRDWKSLGCVLAWLIFNGPQLHLPGMVNSTGVNVNAVRRGCFRKRSNPFPFSLGDLSHLQNSFKGRPLHEVLNSQDVNDFGTEGLILSCMSSINSLSGKTRDVALGPWNKLQSKAVETIRRSVHRCLQMPVSLHRTADAAEKELSERFLAYSGEEVPKMQPLSYDQVVSALPPVEHGGSISATSLVSGRTRSLLMNPEHCILEDDGRILPKLQAKVHFQPGEMMKVSQLLVERNICEWIPLDDVVKYRGERVLNGLFAVGKNSFLDDGREIQRCIMNLIPSNSILTKLEGSVRKLPNICQWLSITLEGNEELSFYQSDMSSAFYLFSLPPGWSRLLAFNVVKDGHELGKMGGCKFVLACRVLPMGWSSAVGVMQEMAENLSNAGKLEQRCRLERTKVVPRWMCQTLEESRETQKAWYHVYLDNFCAAEKVSSSQPGLEAARMHEELESAWRDYGVLSSAKKKVVGAKEVLELGAFVGGSGKLIGGSGERLVRLVQTTLVVLSSKRLRKKWVQLLAGRWVHVLQFRRPGMGYLDLAWAFIAGTKGGQAVENKVRGEFLDLCFGVCLFHTNLNAGIAEVTTASDASSTGGAVGVAKELLEAGKSLVAADQVEDIVPVIPVLVLSLFNGIGGAFRAYDLCGVRPMVLISFDLHGPANRVVSRRWPHAIIEKDVRECTPSKMREWLFKYPDIQAIHVWGGFPCTDLSAAKAFRSNLLGEHSGLFYEIKRILKQLKQVFGFSFDIRFVIENVSSMDAEAEEEISRELGRKPFHVNSAEAVPLQRPRFCWTNVDCEQEIEGATKTVEQRWIHVQLQATYPTDEQWLEEGSTRTPGVVFPTCMKSIVRQRPPPKPIGLSRTSEECQLRWRADDFRFPPYHYRDEFVIWRNGKWRLLSGSERELLHGYGFNHTCLCKSASDIKKSYIAFEDERKSLVGDSFSLYSFVYFAAQAIRPFVQPPSYPQLVARMGMAPGYCAPIWEQIPLCRTLKYNNNSKLAATPSDLHRVLLRRINHTGSDVRISTGTILNPKNYPRQSVQADWWKWEHVFACKWTSPEQINSLELRSILLAVQWQVKHLQAHDLRMFHLTDSYICMAVISKGRSSSRMLMRLLRQLNAWLLTFQLYLIVMHVESSENPTDKGSRMGGAADSS